MYQMLAMQLMELIADGLKMQLMSERMELIGACGYIGRRDIRWIRSAISQSSAYSLSANPDIANISYICAISSIR